MQKKKYFILVCIGVSLSPGECLDKSLQFGGKVSETVGHFLPPNAETVIGPRLTHAESGTRSPGFHPGAFTAYLKNKLPI